jgi:hypothetical protein
MAFITTGEVLVHDIAALPRWELVSQDCNDSITHELLFRNEYDHNEVKVVVQQQTGTGSLEDALPSRSVTIELNFGEPVTMTLSQWISFLHQVDPESEFAHYLRQALGLDG